MNEMNDLETQLRSWAPRPPSARIERQICGGAPAAPDWRAALALWWHSLALASGTGIASLKPMPGLRLYWLASAAAALMFLAVLCGQRCTGNVATAPTSSNPMMALVLSNQSLTAWFPGHASSQRNALPSAILEWTNERPSGSSIRFRD